MIHSEPHPLAGKTVRIKQGLSHPHVEDFGGSEFRCEDYWDRVSGGSWTTANGNPACLVYAMRTGMSQERPPIDDEVLYGKIGYFGHLVHVSEIEVSPSVVSA
ncbi:MAG TPA: hypothetical protein PK093_24495 [Phycisphaerae bacterium]|nr:hypothetical protein [Phycisphaerae bacterium]